MERPSPLEQAQQRRIEELERRLEEAEEALAAIRQGDVDALVVRRGQQEQVYTLEGADHSYRVLFEALNEGTLTLDRDATILYTNGRFAGLVGLPRERLLGKSLRDFVARADLPSFDALLEAGIRGDGRGEVACVAADGRRRLVSLSLNAVDVDEVGPTCTVVVTDVTELRAAQAALVRANAGLEARVEARTGELTATNAALQDEIAARGRLEDALRERAAELAEEHRRKDEFLSMLAHELRNPLAPILNCVEVLGRLECPDPRVERHRLVIERQTRHLARLVDDLLDVSRIIHGAVALKKRVVGLAEVIERAVAGVQPLADAAGHRLAVSLPEESVVLDADPTRLEQVFVNLLNNAVKYTIDGGEIRVVAECQDGCVVVRVRDTGIGLCADLLPRIFDLFVQDARALDRARGGLGIGLTVVKRLVQMHGGRVTVSSGGLGKGSEFAVVLPCQPGTPLPSPLEPAVEPERAAPRRRVLVVEDNVDAAETLAELLEMAGHEVRIAPTGKSGIEAARAQPPEVILCDLGLPGMDGYEVAACLREEGLASGTLLIALTGYGSAEDRARTRKAGFQAHLTKPVDFAELQQLLGAGPGREPG